ncbi:octopamine receptor beta-2R-like [Hydractinia symbiolongicarpus]|uniref:octopamine receptor beta-2R-like n=1 Tax=Hydractinia symbiolongicarpus TaxID=13093 RepID=UPI00254BD327|nr:octopamine receptor beta-2R-like [Hydractinia symbiolongicarpus]
MLNTSFKSDGSATNSTPFSHQSHSSPALEHIIERSVDVSLGFLVVILNIIEIILLCRIKRKLKIHEICILSLSITDLFFGMSNSSVSMVFVTKNAQSGIILDVSYSIYFCFVVNSILHLVLITLDRLWAIFRPIKHNVFFTRKKVYWLLCTTWFVSTVIAISTHLTHNFTETFQTKTERMEYITVNTTPTSSTSTATIETAQPTVSITYIVPVMTTSIASINDNKTRIQFKQKGVKITDINERYHTTMQLVLSVFIVIGDVFLVQSYGFITYWLNKNTNIASRRKGLKISTLCGLITIAFVLLTLPYALCRFIMGNVPYWANLLLVSNSGLNSIVYFFRGRCRRKSSKVFGTKDIKMAQTSSETMSSNNYPIQQG